MYIVNIIVAAAASDRCDTIRLIGGGGYQILNSERCTPIYIEQSRAKLRCFFVINVYPWIP